MPGPSIGVVLPKTHESPRQPSPYQAAEFGERAESLGYESVWTSEGWGGDSFVEMTQLASSTEEIHVGTSVVNVFSRTPAVLAMGSVAVARASDGRVRLGVGAGHPATIEGLHGIEYTRPVTHVKETLELVRAYTEPSEGLVEYDGEVFSVSGYDPHGVDVPLFNAALGERSRRITGRLCDGWLPFNIPTPALTDAFEVVAAGARDADRDPDDLTVTPWIAAAVSEDADRARRTIRENVASYVGRITDDTYKGAVAQRFPEEADRIAAAWRSGDRDAAADAVTDEILDALAVVGTPESGREQLRELLDHPVIDTPILSIPYLADDDVTETTFVELAPRTLA